ncbi:MAG: hypothetical protein ABIO71_00480 [Caldimonas sp.]
MTSALSTTQRFAVAAALATALLGSAPTQAASSGPFEKSGIAALGTGAPVVAMTVDIPSGWRTRGGITWNEQDACLTSAMRYEWQAAAPDGMRAVELLPGFNWQVPGYAVQANPCPVAAIGSAEAFLRSLVNELYPGVAITRYENLTSTLTQPVAKMQNQRLRAEAGRIEIAYRMRGAEMRETLQAMVTFSQVQSYGQNSVMGGVNYVVASRAPKAGFDEGLADQVTGSMVANKPWFEQMMQHAMRVLDTRSAAQLADINRWHARRMAEISAKGAADRSAIRSQTIREVGEINAAGWKSRMASIDGMHRDKVDTIREVNRYADPSTGRQVELSSHYNHGFRTSGGGYVATDDPNFKPGSGGFEMKRTR